MEQEPLHDSAASTALVGLSEQVQLEQTDPLHTFGNGCDPWLQPHLPFWGEGASWLFALPAPEPPVPACVVGVASRDPALPCITLCECPSPWAAAGSTWLESWWLF